MNPVTKHNRPTDIKSRLRRFKRKRIKRMGKAILKLAGIIIYRQSLISTEPVMDKSVFPWIADFENNWERIRAELDEVLKTRDQLPCFHEVSRDQKNVSLGDNWKVFALYVLGKQFAPNCALCPETTRLLEQVPNIRNAMFSILSPRYHIPPHQGPTNALVRIHLALKVPQDNTNCKIRVGEEFFTWKEGECTVFDDFYDHEVWNDTDEYRAVLFFDVDRPLKPLGRLLSRLAITGLRNSAYIKDAEKNLCDWARKTGDDLPTR